MRVRLRVVLGPRRRRSPPGADDGPAPFGATLVELDGAASGQRARTSARTALVRGGVVVLDEAARHGAGRRAAGRPSFEVRSVERRPYRRRPSPPFITSTLPAGGRAQAAALVSTRPCARPRACTRTATSPTCGPTRRRCPRRRSTAARSEIAERYGRQYLPDEPRRYAKKVKNAQEAHEAIRPAGDTLPLARAGRPRGQPGRSPALRADLEAHDRLADDRRRGRDGHRSGSAPPTSRAARGRTWSSRPAARSSRTRASASPTSVDRDEGDDADEQERQLPAHDRGRRARRPLESSPRATRPSRRPATPRRRWSSGSRSSASVVRRPTRRPSRRSRTAATCGRRARRWCRRFTAFAVVNLLEQHFPDLVDYAFTARMEDDLDEIAGGAEELVPWLADFYFGPRRRQRAAPRRAEGDGGRPARPDRRGRGQLDPHRRSTPTACSSWPSLGATTVPTSSAARTRASIPDDAGARRADRREGPRAAGRAQGRPRAGHRSGHRAHRLRQDGPLRALRAARRVRRRRRVEAEDGVAVLDHDRRPRRPRRRARAAVAAPRGRRRSRRRRRDHRRRTAGTGPTSRRSVPTARRTAAASPTRSSCSPSRSTRRWRSSPSPRCAGARWPSRRCASSATTRSAARPW